MIKSTPQVQLGLQENIGQFIILVIVNAFVGAMIGLERTVVPLLAEVEFGLASNTVVLSFLISFGIVKALANMTAGRYSDRIGRKKILILGWLVGLPVPLLLIYAPSWGWIVFANVLLGINQGFCWSTTVIMKIDLVGPKQRGLAMGINEFAGYIAVSAAALGSGYLAATYGLRPIPFLPGIVLSWLGLLASVFLVRDTRAHAEKEAELSLAVSDQPEQDKAFSEVFWLTSWKNKTLFSASQAGMINNLNDGVVWGLVPIYLLAQGLPLAQIGIISAAYPGVWGLFQLGTGALSDTWGRKWLIVSGMWVQALGIGVFIIGTEFWQWLVGAVILGIGTAMVYPTLIASISDIAHPSWRASSVGVYRLWRDSGFAVGAVVAGVLADAFGILAAIGAAAGLTFFSGLVVVGLMKETLIKD